MLAAPVQKVAIQPVGIKASERSVAGQDRTPSRRILGKDLGDQEDLIASAGDCLGDHFLGGTRSVHFCSVNMGHAEIEATTQSGNRGGPILNVPGPLTDYRYLTLRGAK